MAGEMSKQGQMFYYQLVAEQISEEHPTFMSMVHTTRVGAAAGDEEIRQLMEELRDWRLIDGDKLLMPMIPRDRLTDESTFNDFWKLYPRHTAKAAAFTKYRAVLKRRGVTHEKIMTGLAISILDWKQRGQKPEFIPHPATWLNQERFYDEPLDDRTEDKGESLSRFA